MRRRLWDEEDIERMFGTIYIHAPKLPKQKPLNKDATYSVIASDFHFGEHTTDLGAQSILLQLIKDLQPDHVVLNGDLPDCFALSKYPKDPRFKNPLLTERVHMHEFLHRLHQVARGRIYETSANHSGNGVESRWWRYLSAKCPEILELPAVVDALDYRKIWHPEWSRVEIVDHVVLGHALIALHGDIVRGNAAYSAMGMLNKWRVSLIHGHTHRIGQTGYRVPAIGGQKEHQMRAIEGGCMCSLEAPYLSTSNWQKGFTIVRTEEDGNFATESVYIHKERAVCLTTGTEYKAE